MRGPSLWTIHGPKEETFSIKELRVGYPTKNPTTLAILGGDELVGESLKLLLDRAGYHSRYLAEPLEEGVGGLGRLLASVDLLILAPPLDGNYRKALLETPSNSQAVGEIPVIKLIKVREEEDEANLGYPVRWPCRMKELVRQIEQALLLGPIQNGSKSLAQEEEEEEE